MGAVLNGLSLSKVDLRIGILIFSDYGRAPIRLAAIMEIPFIYIFTHDSTASARTDQRTAVDRYCRCAPIPGLITAASGRRERSGRELAPIHAETPPAVVLVLERQDLPTIDRTKYGRPPAWRRARTCSPTRRAGRPK